MGRGDLAAAGALVTIERGLGLARANGDRFATYVALYKLSEAAISLGDHRRARVHLGECISLSHETRDLASLASFLDAVGVLESTDGASYRAAVLFGAAQAMREHAGRR